jgi:hypothetical protein
MTLSFEQYQALRELALKALDGTPKYFMLQNFLAEIEKENNVEVNSILVRWQVRGKPLPAGTSFPKSWPETQQASISVVGRPLEKKDITGYLDKLGVQYTNVFVTYDQAGLVGWGSLEVLFP